MQRSTLNAQRSTPKQTRAALPPPPPHLPPRFETSDRYDLEDRLLLYAAGIIRLVERLPSTRAGNHIAAQMLRSGTSPLPNHGEAQAAESSDDFVHKMRICLKELRETRRWLRLTLIVPLVQDSTEVDRLISETIELVKIFAASIRTSLRNAGKVDGTTRR